MWEELVRDHRGVVIASVDELARAELGAATFAAVLCHDDELLPAVARLSRCLPQGGPPAFLLKEGRVGGTDPDASIEIRREHVEAILDGIEADSIEWETDPDFGYEVAGSVPGIEGRDRFVLIPRFLYARTGRVYHYAARVPELRPELSVRLGTPWGT